LVLGFGEKDLGISFGGRRFSKIISRKGGISMWFFRGERDSEKNLAKKVPNEEEPLFFSMYIEIISETFSQIHPKK
jgi:hypothetical protein